MQDNFTRGSKKMVDSDPTGMSFVLSVESTGQTHWYDAMGAMALIDGSSCPDGGPFSVSFHKPELDQTGETPGNYNTFPAGTVFEQGMKCREVFKDQTLLPFETTSEQGRRILWAALGMEGEFDNDRFAATEVSFNDKSPKYEAITGTLGGMMESAFVACGGSGVQVKRRLIYSRPSPAPEAKVFLNSSSAFVGLEFACLDGQPADRSL